MREWQTGDQRALEQLVDGELPPEERRELLERFEADPEGWRRCALAFLEDQAVRGGVCSLIAEAGRPAAKVSPSVRKKPVWRVGVWVAVAASLLFAFAAGRLLPGGSQEPGQPLVAENDAPTANEAVALAEPEPAEPMPEGDVVTLLVRDTDGVAQRVRVPLVEASGDGAPWGAGDRWDGLRKQLANEGYDLQRRRRFAPLFFEQQDRLVPMAVPVDDAYIVPVSRPVY